jgi:hypothetical protein
MKSSLRSALVATAISLLLTLSVSAQGYYQLPAGSTPITWDTRFQDIPKRMWVVCPPGGKPVDVRGVRWAGAAYVFTADSSICSAVYWMVGSAPRSHEKTYVVDVDLRYKNVGPADTRITPDPWGRPERNGVTLRGLTGQENLYLAVLAGRGSYLPEELGPTGKPVVPKPVVPKPVVPKPVVPKEVGPAGNWSVKFVYQGQPYTHGMKLAQAANSLTGSGFYPEKGQVQYAWTISSGSVSGDMIDFTANYTLGTKATMRVTGKIAPNGSMGGTWSDDYGGARRQGTWTAGRM